MSREPFGGTRQTRAAWVRQEIQAQHADLLRMVPALNDAPTARLPAVWETITHRCMELWALSSELSGLEQP